MGTNADVIGFRIVNANTASAFENRVPDGDGAGGYNEYTDYITYESTVSPPDPPENTTIDLAGITQFDVSWTEPSTGGRIDNYRVQRSVDGGSYSTVATPGSSTTSYTDTDITTDTDYRYRVRSENSLENSDWSYTTTRTSGGAPKTPAIGTPTETSLPLSWTNPAGDLDTVEIHVSTSSGTTLSDYSLLTTDTTGDYTHTGLVNGRTYHYRLVAVYPDGDSSPTSEISETTLLPNPTLDAVTAGYREVVVDWTLNDNNPDGDVTVYRDGGSVTTITELATTSYTDDGLLDGEEYSYYIERATPDASGSTGSLSDVTDLPAPTDLTVDAITATSTDLSWADNHNYGDTEVQYKQSDAASWTTFSTLALNTEAETISDLLNGEQYDARVVAVTEHSSTVDQ
ncbi:fibronectin type III domain-containing protein [Natrinema salsiterrestre]|uniref:Fibronectin type III domain-containing protein n=1 Tax=Natrinema salsiterrestre TaxID=2950540 RepID=A0A9Q4L1N9_9EURY|nr:fibronectin type III domain-containing protein [Natrinema salsiterrestre]MDF9748435.1 fibronectin type III domain-containing protein [Natrinema salsiterrestre]